MVAILRFSFRKTIYKSKSSEFFLPLINPLMATFNETCASTSRKYVAEKGLMMPNLWQTRQSFSLHSSFFVLERYLKSLNFQSFYTTKTSFDGDFQWELCTNFQKKCSWGRYNYVEFFQVTSIFLVAASAFAFRKSFLPLKEAWRWLLSVRRVRSLPDDMKWNKLY